MDDPEQMQEVLDECGGIRMREMMKKLNVVKYATSEEQKKKLLEKGFKPVKVKKAGSDQAGKTGAGNPGKDDKPGGGDGNA